MSEVELDLQKYLHDTIQHGMAILEMLVPHAGFGASVSGEGLVHALNCMMEGVCVVLALTSGGGAIHH